MKTWSRLTAAGGEERGGQWWTEGEGTSQTTCVNDPWTWTTVWGLTVGLEGGLGGGGQRGKNWNNCNRINKNKKRCKSFCSVPFSL